MSISTIYLIDDEPELLALFGEVAKLSATTVQSFTQATHFFDQVDSFGDCSVLVLDLQMPDMDGIEVMRKLAPLSNPPALVLVSGLDSGVLLAAEKLGTAHNLKILATLTKPVRLSKLQQVLEQHTLDKILDNRVVAPAEVKLTKKALQQAIDDDQLILHYQPQVEINTGALVGAEALVRWQHPNYGLIPPNLLIPFAEKSHMLGELTHWVIGNAAKQIQKWQQEGLVFPVSVNISADDITSLVLPETLANILEENQLDPTCLTLEVTERTIMGEPTISLDILTRIRLKGIGLSIDDFGTGYSSLSQLHRVPFTELKIDLSFVANITKDEIARSIVKTCIILGHELGMRVVAEGIETEDQLTLLKSLGCDIAQGYLLSKPVLANEITMFRKSADNLVRMGL